MPRLDAEMVAIGPIPLSASQPARLEPDLIAAQWAALESAGAALRRLAAIVDEGPWITNSALEDWLARADPGQRTCVCDAILDLCAVMEPGLAALVRAAEMGRSPQAPARALWREFVDGRRAVLTRMDRRHED